MTTDHLCGVTIGRSSSSSKTPHSPGSPDLVLSGYSTDDDDDEVETIKVVRLNMRMMGFAPRGGLQITQLQYHEANSECTSWAFALLKPTSIGDIVRLIHAKHRHVFTWSRHGSGCRHWV